MIEMGNTTIYLHKTVLENVDFLAELLELSRSETIETMIRHILDNDLEQEIWEGYKEAMEDLENAIEEAEEEGESGDESGDED